MDMIPEVSLLVSYKVCFLVWISVGYYFRAENKLPFYVFQLGYTVTVQKGTSLVVVCLNETMLLQAIQKMYLLAV